MAETNGEGLAKRWNDWHSSQEGTRCCDFSTIGNGQYLENRLWRAFMAGAAAPFLPSAEELARKFHETYERLAPQIGYETRKESALAWEHVPDKNRVLMIATCAEILAALSSDKVSKEETKNEKHV